MRRHFRSTRGCMTGECGTIQKYSQTSNRSSSSVIQFIRSNCFKLIVASNRLAASSHPPNACNDSDKFADREVDRLAEARSGVIRFAALLEDNQQMGVVVDGLQVDGQRLMAVNARRRGGEECALGAMRQSIPQHAARRTAGRAVHAAALSAWRQNVIFKMCLL